METWCHHLVGCASGIVSLGGYKYPVYVVEAAKMSGEESFTLRRTYYNHTGNTGTAGGIDSIGKVLMSKVVCIYVLQVIVISKHRVMIALKHLAYAFAVFNRQMLNSKTDIVEHHFFGSIYKSVDR